MSAPSKRPVTESLQIDSSRRSACAILGFGVAVLGQRAFSAEKGADWLLAEQYGLMRRAYQTADAESLRQFYSAEVVLASEGANPVVGLEAVIAVGHQVLAKRRDILADVLRVTRSAAGDAISHVAKLTAFPRDPAEPVRIATAFLSWQRSSAGWRCHSEVILNQNMDSVPGFRTTGVGS